MTTPPPQPPATAAQPAQTAGHGYVSPIPVRRTHLGHALAAEWTKIRSVRSTVWTLVAMVAVTLTLTLLLSLALKAALDGGEADIAIMPPNAPIVMPIVLGTLALVPLGVMVMSTEYTSGLIRATLTAGPQRGRLLLAKVLVFGCVAFVVTSLVLVLAQLIAGSFLGDTPGAAMEPGDHWVGSVIGVALYVTLIGLLGLALGGLMRGSAGPITIMVSLVLVLPLFAGLLGLSDALRDIADLLGEYSALNAISMLSYGYLLEDTSPGAQEAMRAAGVSDMANGWPQLGVLAVITCLALAGAYARLSASDA